MSKNNNCLIKLINAICEFLKDFFVESAPKNPHGATQSPVALAVIQVATHSIQVGSGTIDSHNPSPVNCELN